MKNPLKKSAPEPLRRERMRRQQAAPSTSFSYHGRRSEQPVNTGRQSQSVLAKRATERLKGFWLQRFGVGILLIALVVSAINILTLSNNVKIVPLTEDTGLLRNTSEYQKAATKLLANTATSRSKLTVNTATISNGLHQQFPELATVDVTIPLLAHKPIVYVQAVRPAIILSSSSGSYVISSLGKVLESSSQIMSSTTDRLPTISDQSGIALRSNTQALPAATVQFIGIVAAQLAAKNIAITSMTLPQAAGELDVQVSGQPYFIKFNMQASSAKQQVGTYLATIAQLQKQSQTPAKYVDVRVDGRAYYQ